MKVKTIFKNIILILILSIPFISTSYAIKSSTVDTISNIGNIADPHYVLANSLITAINNQGWLNGTNITNVNLQDLANKINVFIAFEFAKINSPVTVKDPITGISRVTWGGWPVVDPFTRGGGLARISNGKLYLDCGNGQNMAEVVFTPVSVVTYHIETEYNCSTRISSHNGSRGDCQISSNWNTSGQINCSQTKTWTAVSTPCGSRNRQVKKTCTDLNPCTTVETIGRSGCGGCSPDASTPADVTETKTLSMDLNNPVSIVSGGYANNSDTNVIRINITGTTNDNKPVTGLLGTTHLDITNITDTSGLKANRINSIGSNALNFGSASSNNQAGGGTNFSFDIIGIKSYAPLETLLGSLRFRVDGVNINVNNIYYKFNKLYTGYFNTTEFKVGTKKKVDLGLIQTNTTNPNIGPYTVGNISNTITALPADKFEVQDKGTDYNTTGPNPSVDLRINYKGSLNINSEQTGAYLSVNPTISYSIDGVNTKYSLSPTDNSSNDYAITSNNAVFDSIKILGTYNTAGKADLTGQGVNFANMTKLETKTKIKKSVYSYIKNMTPGQTLSGVHYVNGGNITISGNSLGYETLVVNNGNVIINGNIDQKLGIIVLKDGYKVTSDYATSGNVYITPNVSYVRAAIYADGGIISVKSATELTEYNTDSEERTTVLGTQLIIKGSLITKNTVGGAIKGTSGQYILPGGGSTSNFNNSMIYDLNYLRRGKGGCDHNSNLNCSDPGEYDNTTVIIYDPSIQNNPPKLFGE